MRAALVAVALLVAGGAQAAERRCGWLENPTPANWWLTDRHGTWTLGEQGGYQAPGMDVMPDMTTAGWVTTNAGSYGYGCACLLVEADLRSMRITQLLSAEPVPISRCRNDRALRRPG